MGDQKAAVPKVQLKIQHAGKRRRVDDHNEIKVPRLAPIIGIVTGPDSEYEGEKIARYLKYKLSIATEREEAIGYMTSLLCRFAPKYAEKFEKGLIDDGYKVEKVPFNSIVDRRVPRSEAVVTQNAMVVLMGQLCLLPFKNFSPATFINYMEARTRTLCQKAGMSKHECSSKPVSLDIAVSVQNKLGSNNTYRGAIIEMLMELSESRRDMLINVAVHLLDLLSWVEMRGLIFVYETLIKYGSPILCDNAVRQEVANVRGALLLVNKTPHPQFFRVFGDPKDQYKLERNRYAKLFSIATGVHSATAPSSSRNSMSTERVNDEQISRLIDLHMRYERSRNDQLPACVTPFLEEVVSRRRLTEDMTQSFLKSFAGPGRD